MGSDASELYYGAWCQMRGQPSGELGDSATQLASAPSGKLFFRGEWDEEERKLHINELELIAAARAVDFALECCDAGLFPELDGITALNTVAEVATLVDSRVASAYVRRAGGSNKRCALHGSSVYVHSRVV